MKNIMRSWGPVGVWLFALAVALVLGLLIVYTRPPTPDEVAGDLLTSDPRPPEHDLEDGRGPDMPRGRSVGATPNRSYPRPVDRGFNYSFIASPHWSSRGVHQPEAIVVHVFGSGTCSGLKSWFQNPSAQVSAHFGVCKNGEVVQFVEVGDAAWHAGHMNRPHLDQPRIRYWWENGINPNYRTVGVEVDLKPGERIGDYPVMAATFDDLLLWLLQELDLEPHRGNILGHFEIDSVNRAVDPICCIGIDQAADYAKARLRPEEPAPIEITLESLDQRLRAVEETLGLQ